MVTPRYARYMRMMPIEMMIVNARGLAQFEARMIIAMAPVVSAR
jgi:hypothetical protein